MARAMDKRVVAESVDSISEIEYLKKRKCHEGKEYYFSRPMSSSQVEVFLEQYITQDG